MSKVKASTIERIIANTINETARGDPDALQPYPEIVSSNRAETRQLSEPVIQDA